MYRYSGFGGAGGVRVYLACSDEKKLRILSAAGSRRGTAASAVHAVPRICDSTSAFILAAIHSSSSRAGDTLIQRLLRGLYHQGHSRFPADRSRGLPWLLLLSAPLLMHVHAHAPLLHMHAWTPARSGSAAHIPILCLAACMYAWRSYTAGPTQTRTLSTSGASCTAHGSSSSSS